MRLRQVVWVAQDLEPVVNLLEGKLGLEVGYRDPNVAFFGLQNALLPVGDSFIEVVSPVQAGTTAGRFLEKRGGDGGYMLLIQVDDLAAEKDRLQKLEVRIVWEGQGDGIRGMHIHPQDIGGAIVSLDEAEPPDSWGWAGKEWRDHVRTDVVSGIAGAEVQCDSPQVRARRWADVLDQAVDHTTSGDAVVDLDGGGSLRFVKASDGRGDGLSGFQLVAVDRTMAGQSHDIAGVKVRLV